MFPLHQFCLQCNCSILSLPPYMFVVAVLTTLPSLCSAMFSLLRALLLSSSTPLAIDLISVLQRSYGGKASPWRISSHLLCLLFCVREIVHDSPIVNFVSQTLNKHITLMNTTWKCALVMLHCLVTKNAPWRQTTVWGHGGHHRIYTSIDRRCEFAARFDPRAVHALRAFLNLILFLVFPFIINN